MRRDAPFVTGEFYHLFNRGAHKNKIFLHEGDYSRFQLLMHLGNSVEQIAIREILKKYKGSPLSNIFEEEIPDKGLVDVLAYCLMPNHFHLILRQKSDNGITQFLKRSIIGYSMYFNLSKKHEGTVFQGLTKSRHINNEPYFRYIFSYLHLNPLDLVEPKWKEKGLSGKVGTKKFIHEYPYSSFFDYAVDRRPEKSILAYDSAPDFLKSSNDFEDLIRWHKGGEELYTGTENGSR